MTYLFTRLRRARPALSGHLSFVIDQGTTMNKTLFLLLSLSLLWGCMDDPFENHSLQLEAEAGVTEAWLSLHVQGLKNDAVYTLQRNGNTIFNSRLQTADTVIYDSLLTPATSYRYRFFATDQGETSPAAETVLTTMDTTSHDFDWQVYTFGGQKGSSVFYDVAIIDENDIWAVGEIYTADTYTYDSLGNWIDPYNAAHWDGQNWTLTRIYYTDGSNKYWRVIKSIFAFSKNDIFFGNFVHWDGKKYNSLELNISFPSKINKIWGTSSSDLYVVGNNGLMAHYDGTGWTRIETGTELDIRDIWGVEDHIMVVASNYNSRARRILTLKEKKFSSLPSTPVSSDISSIWFGPDFRQYYISTGEGIFHKAVLSASSWRRISFAESSRYYLNRIRGLAGNDIFFVGHYGEVLHYNGLSFRSYRAYTDRGGVYNSLDVSKERIIAVGHDGRAGVIAVGLRK